MISSGVKGLRCRNKIQKSWRATAPVVSRVVQTCQNHHVVHDERPFRMAIIGSGPAGFYSAYKVMSMIPTSVVDMYEKLPVPFGLVRFGVAPDHPEVKNCQDKFSEVASSPNFNFIGNVEIGKDLSLLSLKPHYDAILFAHGASKDRELGISGEKSLKGIYSARAFVGWYNGLPEYADLAPDLTVGEEAIIIGQGNVALDVARTLLSDVDRLRSTDITSSALHTLSKSRVKRVRIVGRRGPLQASFTIKEVRELLNLPSVSFDPLSPALLPPDPSKLPRAQKRLVQLLNQASSSPFSTPASSNTNPLSKRSWSLNFFLSPLSFNPSPDPKTPQHLLSSLTFAKTILQASSDPHSPTAKVSLPSASGTTSTTTLHASLAFRSIGYKSQALPGFSDLGIPFDNNLGIIPNDGEGRVLASADIDSKGSMEVDVSSSSDNDHDSDNATHHVPVRVSVPAPIPGIYCAGWVKNGPTGVIATTMADAFLTAESIATDWESKKLPFLGQGRGQRTGEAGMEKKGWHALAPEAVAKGVRRVDWKDWLRIDQAERARGRERGKEREKVAGVEEMLRVLE